MARVKVPGKIWTNEEDEKIRSLVRQEIPVKQIAKILDRSEVAVRQRAYRMGIRPGRSRERMDVSLDAPGVYREQLLRTRDDLLLQIKEEEDPIKRAALLSSMEKTGHHRAIALAKLSEVMNPQSDEKVVKFKELGDLVDLYLDKLKKEIS